MVRSAAGRPARSDRDVDGAYRELRATVARGLAYRTGSSDLAEDLTQDVFVDLLVAARCRPPSNTRAWLARVAQRHVADTIGSAVRERATRARLEAASRARSTDAARPRHPPRDPREHGARSRRRSSDHRAAPARGPVVRALRPDARHERGCRPHALPPRAAGAPARARRARAGGALMLDGGRADVAVGATGASASARRGSSPALGRGASEAMVLRLLARHVPRRSPTAMVSSLLRTRAEAAIPLDPARAGQEIPTTTTRATSSSGRRDLVESLAGSELDGVDVRGTIVSVLLETEDPNESWARSRRSTGWRRAGASRSPPPPSSGGGAREERRGRHGARPRGQGAPRAGRAGAALGPAGRPRLSPAGRGAGAAKWHSPRVPLGEATERAEQRRSEGPGGGVCGQVAHAASATWLRPGASGGARSEERSTLRRRARPSGTRRECHLAERMQERREDGHRELRPHGTPSAPSDRAGACRSCGRSAAVRVAARVGLGRDDRRRVQHGARRRRHHRAPRAQAGTLGLRATSVPRRRARRRCTRAASPARCAAPRSGTPGSGASCSRCRRRQRQAIAPVGAGAMREVVYEGPALAGEARAPIDGYYG